MKHVWFTTLVLLFSLGMAACGGTVGTSIPEHAGVYTTTGVNTDPTVIRISANGAIVGSLYATVNAAQTAASNYQPNDPNAVGTVRGTIAYSDPEVSAHVNVLVLTLQFNTDPSFVTYARFTNDGMISGEPTVTWTEVHQ